MNKRILLITILACAIGSIILTVNGITTLGAHILMGLMFGIISAAFMRS